MSKTLNKINIPSSTLELLPNINNKTAEVTKINELTFKQDRTNQGQMSWVSPTSGVTYNTESVVTNIDVYNCGETGLLNLLQQECSNFLVSASDFQSLGEHYTIFHSSNVSGGRYYKIAQITQLSLTDSFNQLSLLIGGAGDRYTAIRNYFFVDFSTNSNGTYLNVNHLATTNVSTDPAILNPDLMFFGYNFNENSNMVELWVYLSSTLESFGINVINNYENNQANIFEVGDLEQSSTQPVGFVKADDQHILSNTDISNPNILINTNFRNPVNQRALTTYTTASGTLSLYTIDRWKLSSNIVGTNLVLPNTTDNNTQYTTINILASSTASTDVHTLTQELPIESFRQGVPYTLQIYVSNIEFVNDLFVQGNTGSNLIEIARNNNNPEGTGEGIISINFIINSSLSLSSVVIGVELKGSTGVTNSVGINWIKLEKGYMRTQYLIENYTSELEKCQRYYYRINSVNQGSNTLSGYYPTNIMWKNIATSTSSTIYSTLMLPTIMRIKPTVVVATSTVYAMYLTNTTTSAYVTAMTILGDMSSNHITIQTTLNTTVSAGLGGVLSLYVTSSTAPYIAFDAEY